MVKPIAHVECLSSWMFRAEEQVILNLRDSHCGSHACMKKKAKMNAKRLFWNTAVIRQRQAAFDT